MSWAVRNIISYRQADFDIKDIEGQQDAQCAKYIEASTPRSSWDRWVADSSL